MQPSGYSPYQKAAQFKKRSFLKLKVHWKEKKWPRIVLGVLFSLFLVFYLSLGDLRFFANHYLGLTFLRKHYVVIFQNNYELRPGGGFVTAYGELTTTLGFPSSIHFNNSYEIETESYVTPPYPHEKFLKNQWYQGYTFRDANWNPNFPQAAQELKEFYQKQFPEKEVDGMIVVNFSVLETLVKELGGVQLEGELVDADELFSLITQEVNNVDRHDEESLMNRKDMLAPLYNAVMKKAKWHPFKVKRVLEQGLEEKELYLWLDSKRLQRKLEKRNWANQLSLPTEEDFLALNVANLGSKKSDRYLEKELHHFIDLSSAVPTVRTEITFRLPGNPNQYVSDYKGYFRLYLPKGAQVTENLSESKVSNEENATLIAQELEFKVGEQRTFIYKYTLPATLWKGETYGIKLIKQSGSELFAHLVLQGPANQRLESENLTARENKAFWRGVLKKDESLKVQLRPDVLAPYPVEQGFKDLKTLVIEWNEPLAEGVARDATHYELVDGNVLNKQVSDKVRVVYAQVEGNRVILELDGVTDQPLERYALTMKNLRDASGNPTDPEQLEVTVVQRLAGATEVTEGMNAE